MTTAIKTGVRRAVIIFTALVAGLILGTAIVHNQGDSQRVRLDPSVPLPTAQKAPATIPTARYLLDQHHCWSGEAPKDMRGQIPGHVVVTRPDGSTTYAGRRLTGQALGQLFAGERHGLTVWGFCR